MARNSIDMAFHSQTHQELSPAGTSECGLLSITNYTISKIGQPNAPLFLLILSNDCVGAEAAAF